METNDRYEDKQSIYQLVFCKAVPQQLGVYAQLSVVLLE